MPYDVRRDTIRTRLDTMRERGAFSTASTGYMDLLNRAVESDDLSTLQELERATDAWFAKFGNDAQLAG